MALLFFSGKANIIDASKIVFPMQFKKPAANANTHIKTKFRAKNVAIIQGTDSVNPRLINQNCVLGFSLTIPSTKTAARQDTEYMEIKYPYISTENPFSKQKGSINVNAPAASRLTIKAQGTNIFKHPSVKMVFAAVN